MKRCRKQKSLNRRERLLKKDNSVIELLDTAGELVFYITHISVRRETSNTFGILAGTFKVHPKQNVSKLIKVDNKYNIFIATNDKITGNRIKSLIRDVVINDIDQNKVYWRARTIHPLLDNITPEDKIKKDNEIQTMRAWNVENGVIQRSKISQNEISKYINNKVNNLLRSF